MLVSSCERVRTTPGAVAAGRCLSRKKVIRRWMAATWKNRSSRKRQGLLAAGSAPVHEDPVVVLGSGILGHTGFERSTSRYGAVHLTVLDSVPGEPAPARTVPVPPDEDLASRILQDLAKADARYAAAAEAASQNAARRPDNRVVAFDHAPLGAAGTLVAHVIHVTATDNDREFGKRHPELRPPEPGERIVLGSGTLFTEKYGDGPVIGVRPDDGRAEDWMDSNAIFRCKDQLVRLEFEMPTESAPGAAVARRVQAARQDTQQGLSAMEHLQPPPGGARPRPAASTSRDQGRVPGPASNLAAAPKGTTGPARARHGRGPGPVPRP